MSMTLYVCAGRVFVTAADAIEYANFLHKVSGLIVAVEELKE